MVRSERVNMTSTYAATLADILDSAERALRDPGLVGVWIAVDAAGNDVYVNREILANSRAVQAVTA
jgi:hypothetical protein